MRASRNTLVLAGLLAVGLALAVPALATFQPVVVYDPPKIVFKDLAEEASAENVDVTKEGGNYRFVNTGGASVTSSDPECDFVPGGVDCPVAGIEKIDVRLGDLGDQAEIDLGSRAHDVIQVIRGQHGNDIILGHKGPQRLRGGGDVDTLQGGAGDDILNGGAGPDTCSGGPGHDTLINCEA